MARKGGGNSNPGAAPATLPVDDQAGGNLPATNDALPASNQPATNQPTPMAGTDRATNQPAPIGAEAAALESAPATSPVIDWMKQRGFAVPDDYNEDAFHSNLLESLDAMEENERLRQQIAAFEAKPNSLASAPAPAAGVSANTPANTPAKITAPQIRREWLAQVQDGQHPDPAIQQKLVEYQNFVQDHLPTAIERVLNMDADIDARIEAAVAKAQQFTEQKLTSQTVEQQFNSFMLDNFAVRGPQGPVVVRTADGGSQYQITQEGMRAMAQIEDLVAGGMSDFQAKQFVMKHNAPVAAPAPRFGKAAPAPLQTPAVNRTQAPQQEPIRRTHQPPTNRVVPAATRTARMGTNLVEMCQQNAALMGAQN